MSFSMGRKVVTDLCSHFRNKHGLAKKRDKKDSETLSSIPTTSQSSHCSSPSTPLTQSTFFCQDISNNLNVQNTPTQIYATYIHLFYMYTCML